MVLYKSGPFLQTKPNQIEMATLPLGPIFNHAAAPATVWFPAPAPAPAAPAPAPAPAAVPAAGVPDLNRIMQYLEAIDRKADKLITIEQDVKALIKSNSSNSSELRMINAELCVIVDSVIVPGNPNLRGLIDQKRAEAREPA